MSQRHRNIAAAIYLAGAVIAFGHSAAGNSGRCNLPAEIAEGGCMGQAAIAGLFAGTFWPLYWSWEVFGD